MNKFFIRPCFIGVHEITDFYSLRGKIVEGIICSGNYYIFRHGACQRTYISEYRSWCIAKRYCVVLNDTTYKLLKDSGIKEIGRDEKL